MAAAVVSLLFIPPLHAGELYYRIQLSAWRELSSATRHYEAVRKQLAGDDCRFLRLEKVNRAKSPYRYGVYIGRFREKGEAAEFLKKCQTAIPKAFVFRGLLKPKDVVLDCSRDKEGQEPPPSGGAGAAGLPDKAEPEVLPDVNAGPAASPADPAGGSQGANMALVTGTLVESGPVSPDLLGIDQGQALYKLVVFVEDAEEIRGYPNYLGEKKQQTVTFFTADPVPSPLIGKRIRTRAQYRGNKYGRHFWIEKVREAR